MSSFFFAICVRSLTMTNHSNNTDSSIPIRVRFAPSPTGYLHVGGARTVLFNWLFAKHHNGTFVLRIEDTDQERSTAEAERMQIQDIKWLGFDYQEGPDVGGPYGPYRQSERLDIYAKYAQELLQSGRAYYCFCTDETLTAKREAAMASGAVPQYDGTCRGIALEEAQRRIATGEKPAVRFRAPVKDYILADLVRGDVTFQANMVGDFVVLRASGMPVYNFCCVIDDHLMKISHVIRAEEHLSNTVRQMMLYESFGWPLPKFAHCSLILGSDRQKLSKRHGATSVNQYREAGYLRECLINFLALLGWSSPDHKEILTIEELIQNFDLDRINKAPSIFDPVKLNWMNGEYIRKLPIDVVTQLAKPYIDKDLSIAAEKSTEWLCQAVDSIRGHLEILADAPKYLQMYFQDEVAIEDDGKKLFSEPTFEAVGNALRDALQKHEAEQGDVLSAEAFQKIQEVVKTTSGAKGKNLFMPMRVCLTGQTHGPELKLVVPLLGTKRCLRRILGVLNAKNA